MTWALPGPVSTLSHTLLWSNTVITSNYNIILTSVFILSLARHTRAAYSAASITQFKLIRLTPFTRSTTLRIVTLKKLLLGRGWSRWKGENMTMM